MGILSIILTIVYYSNSITAPENTQCDFVLQMNLWNESLVTDAESWEREQYNNQFYWEDEDNLDPLFGLDL